MLASVDPSKAFSPQQFDLLPIGICVIDRDLNVHAWNKSLVDWTGRPAHAMVGTRLIDSYPHLNSTRFAGRIRDVFENDQIAIFSPSLNYPFLPTRVSAAATGKTMVQKTIVQPLIGSDDLALVTITDVTVQFHQIERLRTESTKLLASEVQLTRAKQQAESANQAKSCFLANMSHEIRTPMTAILGFTDLLLDDLEDPDNIEAATTIKRNGEFLLSLINDILDLSKVEADKVQLEHIDCCPRTIINDVASLMQVRADSKGLRLDVTFDQQVPEVIQTDPSRLKQILVNLVGNAIKFTSSGSVNVVVSCRSKTAAQAELIVQVIDTGIGVSEAQRSRLFEPFMQADNSTTRKFGGTGLGLAISRKLVEALGGEISLSSTVGQGSAFAFSLPIDNIDESVTQNVASVAIASDIGSTAQGVANWHPISAPNDSLSTSHGGRSR